MRGAVEALAQGLFGEAVADQSQAVDALTRAIDAAGQAMAQKLGSMMGLSEGEGPNGGGTRDIFGRSANGQRGFGTGPLAIPDHSEIQRAHEISRNCVGGPANGSVPVPNSIISIACCAGSETSISARRCGCSQLGDATKPTRSNRASGLRAGISASNGTV